MRFENFIKIKSLFAKLKGFFCCRQQRVTILARLAFGKALQNLRKTTILGMDICFNIKYNISIKNYQIILDCRKRQKTI